MDKIREALDTALSLIGELMSYDNWMAYPPNVAERVEEFIAPFDAEGIDLLSAPATRDARDLEVELCKEMFGDSPDPAVLQRRVERLIEYRESIARGCHEWWKAHWERNKAEARALLARESAEPAGERGPEVGR